LQVKSRALRQPTRETSVSPDESGKNLEPISSRFVLFELHLVDCSALTVVVSAALLAVFALFTGLTKKFSATQVWGESVRIVRGDGERWRGIVFPARPRLPSACRR